MPYSETDLQRFGKRVVLTEKCWLWKGELRKGYGLIRFGKKKVTAHRMSWQIHNGPIPEGMFVCHKCDIKICVNPDHLFLGSNLDNLIDMHTKGFGLARTRPRNYYAHSLVLIDGAGI